MRRCRRGAHWSTSGEGGQHCDDEERRQLELTIERRRARESSGVRGEGARCSRGGARLF
jgi:hypothetical protein